MQHPEYAIFVLSLFWILLLLEGPKWDDNYPYPLLGTHANREPIDRPVRHFQRYRPFEMPTRVEHDKADSKALHRFG